MRRITLRLAAALLAFASLQAVSANAQVYQKCYWVCDWETPCNQACQWEDGEWTTCGEFGICGG